MSDQEPVRYDISEGIATVTINRPERKNALSVEAMNGLTEAWARAEADAAVRAIILTSADCGVFCAGLDLKQAAEIRARDGVDILTLMRDPMQTAMRKVTKPIIAAMTGSLMAGGMMLALKSDLRVGLSGSRAGITEVKMGRGTPWSVPMLWMLPQPLMMELVLTGETMPIEPGRAWLSQLSRTGAGCGARPRLAIGARYRRGRSAIGEGRQGNRAGGDGPRLRARRHRRRSPACRGLRQPGCDRGATGVRREEEAELAGALG